MTTGTRVSGNSQAPPPGGHRIAIRARGEDKKLIEASVRSDAKSDKIICRMARDWGYILRVRTRWAGDPDMRGYFADKAIADFKDLGIGVDTLQKFASVQHIEVEHYSSEAKLTDGTPLLDVASQIPWEYLLSSATQKAGRFDSLLVTRCLANDSTVVRKRPRNFLFVESAPGRIEQEYGFDDEETRLSAAVRLKEKKGLTFSKTEPFSKLQDKIRKTAWDAVHVTGVDTHQAAWLIEDFYADDSDPKRKNRRKNDIIDKSDRLQDGMILRGDSDSELPVACDKLAELLVPSQDSSNGRSKRPGVISLNLYYSGARTARKLVEHGVYAALGFLDEINDEFAELFFQAFYWAWCHDGQSIPDAFLEAWSAMDGDRMHGTGIVIWLGHSMVEDSDSSAIGPARAKTARRGGR